MSHTIDIDVYGKAENLMCAGCSHGHADHACTDCNPGDKKRTIDLVRKFEQLLGESELRDRYSVHFYESTPKNIVRNYDVQRLLSMAELEPVVCIGDVVSFLGGFSPEGLLDELRKKQ
ncbi:MAG: hypothetical protein JXM71_00615 [Spirochaetales bacterium]|nr:hypothetical protein [Spirochaetales bacterium]